MKPKKIGVGTPRGKIQSSTLNHHGGQGEEEKEKTQKGKDREKGHLPPTQTGTEVV